MERPWAGRPGARPGSRTLARVLVTRELPRALAQRGVPLPTRWSILATALRRRVRPAGSYQVRFGRARVPLSHADYGIDWETMRQILVDRVYELDYRDAVVVDVGAHKGCFAAFALEQGARTVLSFEPEETNFTYLQRCAAAYGDPLRAWHVHRAAVGGAAGTADLHVMTASWGHALVPSPASSVDEVGVQRVPVVPMEHVLGEADSLAGSSPLVVKVNAEGAECDIVLGTPVAAWERVAELMLEVHSWAPCTVGDIAAHVSGAGLRPAPYRSAAWVHRFSTRP